MANYEKKEKEEEMERQRLREERAKKGFTIDPKLNTQRVHEKNIFRNWRLTRGWKKWKRWRI